MNKYIKYALVIFCTVSVFSSCDLDRFPKSALIKETSLQSVSDLQNWDNSAISYFRARALVGVVNSEIQGGMLNAGLDFGNERGEFYYWTPLQVSTGGFSNAWYNYYFALKNVNTMIEIGSALTVSDAERATFNQCMGDAYFLRAYYGYQLATKYCKAYNESTASTDLGLPLVETYDVNGLPSRSTLAKTFSWIKTNLDKAKQYFEAIEVNSNDVINVNACYSLEARIALWMKDWAKAAEASEKLTTSNKYQLVTPTQQSFDDMWHHDSSTEDILSLYISKPDELPGNFGLYIHPLQDEQDEQKVAPTWLPSKWVVDLYDDTDLRKSVYFSKKTVKLGDTETPDIWCIFKFSGNPEYSNITDHKSWGVIPSNILKPKVFRLAEQYMILAEAKYHMGDETAAKTALNALRKSRGLAEVNSTGEALLTDIENERMREFAFEGFYFFDLKRWGKPMHRHDPQTNSAGESPFLAYADNAFEYTVQPTDFRWVWPIPLNDMQTNSNLAGQQNPGW